MKADVLHVQPPASILEHILTVRLHLDPCGKENGALRVLPGSYTRGEIPEEEIPALRVSLPEQVCAVGLGGALLMRLFCSMRRALRASQGIAVSSMWTLPLSPSRQISSGSLRPPSLS